MSHRLRHYATILTAGFSSRKEFRWSFAPLVSRHCSSQAWISVSWRMRRRIWNPWPGLHLVFFPSNGWFEAVCSDKYAANTYAELNFLIYIDLHGYFFSLTPRTRSHRSDIRAVTSKEAASISKLSVILSTPFHS